MPEDVLRGWKIFVTREERPHRLPSAKTAKLSNFPGRPRGEFPENSHAVSGRKLSRNPRVGSL